MTRDTFLEGVSNWSNHRLLLWQALQDTKGAVTELGSGTGSTPFLRAFCEAHQRPFSTFDSNQEWAKSTGSVWVQDWDSIRVSGSVLLIDHAPGERRKVDLARYANDFDIIVAHDTEPPADHGYQMRAVLAEFKHAAEVPTQGAWASAVSNKLDLRHWEGIRFGDLVIRAGLQSR